MKQTTILEIVSRVSKPNATTAGNVFVAVGAVTMLVGVASRVAPNPGSSVADPIYTPYTGPMVLGLPSGEDGTIRSSDRNVIIAFRSDCPWTHASIDSWNRIANALSERVPNGNAIAISGEPREIAAQYIEDRGLRFGLVEAADSLMRAWDIKRVPTTLVVDKSGVVLGAWVGALNALRAREVLAVISR